MSSPNPAAPPKRKKFFPKKSQWARHRSHELSVQASQLRTEPVTDARHFRRRQEAIGNLQAEAGRFARLALYYEERGL